MKRAVFAILFAAAALGLGAQQVTKVGICDFSRVLNTSYREAKTIREFLDAQATIRKEQAAIEKEIAEDQNVALGIVMGAMMLGIAIIVAAAIH
jgi:Skp family chaperone for outer membrane proteins